MPEDTWRACDCVGLERKDSVALGSALTIGLGASLQLSTSHVPPLSLNSAAGDWSRVSSFPSPFLPPHPSLVFLSPKPLPRSAFLDTRGDRQ